MSFQRDNK